MSESYKVYASQEYVDHKFNDVSGLPSGSSPNQYIVTDGEGNAKWEDKLCWSESIKEVVLAECQPESAGESDGLVYFALDYIGLVDGETYIVNYNGKDYKTKATVFALDNSGSIALGNLALGYDGKDTGEPFVLFDHPERGCEVGQMDGTTTLTISIRRVTETIHPIDEKYLPESVIITMNEDGSGSCNYNFAETKKALYRGAPVYLQSIPVATYDADISPTFMRSNCKELAIVGSGDEEYIDFFFYSAECRYSATGEVVFAG